MLKVRNKSLIFVMTVLASACVTGQAAGVDLYFNSFGWSNVYRVQAGQYDAEFIDYTDISDTTFLSAADFGPDGRLYGFGASGNLDAINVSGTKTVWSVVAAMDEPGEHISFGPNGTIWTAEGSDIWAVDPAGPTVLNSRFTPTYLGNSINIWGIEFDAAGTLYVIDPSTLYTVDRVTGIATKVIDKPREGSIFTEIDIASDGIVRMLSSSSGGIYEYDPSTDSIALLPERVLYQGSSFSPSSLASFVPYIGDLNGDGGLTNADIAPFVQALTDPEQYSLDHPALDPDLNGDFNGDGQLSNADIAGFVALLTGGDSAALAVPVPEPGSLVLLGTCGLFAIRRRR